MGTVVPLAAQPAPARRATTASAGIRLTSRGRWLSRALVAALLVTVVVAGVLLLGRTAEAGPQVGPVPVRYHVVLPGETLWQIAAQNAPTADRQAAVAELLDLNALESPAVSVGQRIAVPVRQAP